MKRMHDDLHGGSNGMESTRRLDWKCPMFDPKKRCKFPCERVLCSIAVKIERI